jgi:hypothetical protein
MAVNNIFGASSIDDLADNVLSGVDDFMLTVEKMQKRKVASNVQLVVQALKKIESDLQDKYDGVTTVIEKRVSTIKDGRDGINGRDGRDGKDGRPGKDGLPGARGRDGDPGQDGTDGMDGVSVTDARIDFDGSLIIVLSSGREINVGEVVTPDLAERIKVITNGGGTSQGVLDTLASLQAQINLLSSALVYAGTWNASTNTPTLASGVGTANTFYIVSVAGTTTLNGISNWGVGDWAIFNGTVWQRVEGGAEGNFTNLSVSGTTTLSGGTANGVMYLNGSKVVTTGSALAFDGTNLALGGSAPSTSSGYSKMRMNGTTGGLLELTSNGTQVLQIQADGAAAGAKIVTAFNGSNPPLILGVNGFTEVLLTNGGMGLGTAITAVTSGYKLDVQAAKALTLLTSTTGTNEVFHRINNIGGNFTLGLDSLGGAQTGTGYASYLWSTANTPLVLGTNNAAVATFSAAGNLTLNTGTFTYSAGTANGVAYLNGSKVLTTGSALTFDGSALGVAGRASLTGGGLTGSGNGMHLYFDTGSNTGFIKGFHAGVDDRAIRMDGLNLQFAVAGTEGMRLTSTGLGIGESSPRSKLDVTGTTGITWAAGGTSLGLVTVGTQGSGGSLLINTPSVNASFASGLAIDGTYDSGTSKSLIRLRALGVNSGGPYTSDLSFSTTWGATETERMRLDSSGNLGIGTSSPLGRLHTSETNGINYFESPGISSIALQFRTNGTNRYRIGTPSASTDLQFLAGGTTETMRLDSSGNLGIGTSSPGSFAGTKNLVVGGGSGNPVLTLYGGASTYSGVYFADGASGSDRYRGFFEYNHSTDSLAIGTTASTKATLDSSGNLGLGVTPSAWSGSFKALQIGAGLSLYDNGTGSGTFLGANFFFNGTNNIYRNSTFATAYGQSGGTHTWFTAPSGTAGDPITFTQALTLDANRNLLLNGTAAPASGVGTFAIFNGTAPTGSVTDGIVLYAEDVSSSSELKVRDEAGNVTTLSPHNFDLIPEGPSEDMAWSYYSERDGKRINVDMLKAIRLLEKLSGEKLVHFA